MVNDVLQKHKAFWHPGRGSPYQLNLAEGRARREFPSNAKGRSENVYNYVSRQPKRKHKRKETSRVNPLPVSFDVNPRTQVINDTTHDSKGFPSYSCIYKDTYS